MNVSSRTPEGRPNHCPICDSSIHIDPSNPFGDAPCPSCGQLLWFAKQRDGLVFYDSATAAAKKSRIRQVIAERLGVSLSKVPEEFDGLDEVRSLAADSLDFVELVMELEEEFDLRLE